MSSRWNVTFLVLVLGLHFSISDILWVNLLGVLGWRAVHRISLPAGPVTMATTISLLAGPDIPPVYLQAVFLVTKVFLLSYLQEAARASRGGVGNRESRSKRL